MTFHTKKIVIPKHFARIFHFVPSRSLMLSISIGVIGVLGLIIRELRNAPISYESEDGFTSRTI